MIKINRLWNGYADVRDYVVHKAVEKKSLIKLEFNGEVKTFHPSEFVKINQAPQVSKFDGRKYYLLGVKWNKDERKQPTLFGD